jgi:hypothetical protein
MLTGADHGCPCRTRKPETLGTSLELKVFAHQKTANPFLPLESSSPGDRISVESFAGLRAITRSGKTVLPQLSIIPTAARETDEGCDEVRLRANVRANRSPLNPHSAGRWNRN